MTTTAGDEPANQHDQEVGMDRSQPYTSIEALPTDRSYRVIDSGGVAHQLRATNYVATTVPPGIEFYGPQGEKLATFPGYRGVILVSESEVLAPTTAASAAESTQEAVQRPECACLECESARLSEARASGVTMIGVIGPGETMTLDRVRQILRDAGLPVVL